MSVIQAVTVTMYRGRTGKLRRRAFLAYRDAAWAKIAKRCKCAVSAGDHVEPPKYEPCRYHNPDFRLSYAGPEREMEFRPPRVWHLPHSDRWDYGRAVAYRLARFYQHLDAARSSRERGTR